MRKNIISSLTMFFVAVTTCLLTACSQPAKPEVDIGERTSKISWMDGEKKEKLTISTTDVAAGSQTAPVTAIRTYGHGISDATQIYRVKTPTSRDADYVASQDAFMIWVDNVLFRFQNPYKIEKLSKRPEVTLSKLPTNTDLSSFYELTANRRFEVGRPSFDRQTISVHAARLLTRQTTYVTEFLNTSTAITAGTVSSLDGWVFSMGNQWYHVTANKTVEPLARKPQHDLGIRHDMISGKDEEDKSLRKVTATGWSLDRKHLKVQIEQHYEHYLPLENEVYEVQREQHANYSSYYEGWIVDVEGDTYLFDLKGCRTQDTARDAKIQFGSVPEELKSSSKQSTCSPKPEQPAPEQPKAEVNAGRLTKKIQNFDKENLDDRKVTPLNLKFNDDDTTYAVMVTRHYVNESKTTLTRYYIQKQMDAAYNASKRGYVLKVGKDTYVISNGKIRQLDN